MFLFFHKCHIPYSYPCLCPCFLVGHLRERRLLLWSQRSWLTVREEFWFGLVIKGRSTPREKTLGSRSTTRETKRVLARAREKLGLMLMDIYRIEFGRTPRLTGLTLQKKLIRGQYCVRFSFRMIYRPISVQSG